MASDPVIQSLFDKLKPGLRKEYVPDRFGEYDDTFYRLASISRVIPGQDIGWALE